MFKSSFKPLAKMVLLLLLSASFLTNQLYAQDRKFAHEINQMEPDAKAKFGTLKNGFQYVLYPNKKPEKQVLVYLVVNTGSLNETEKIRGIAHFLEHMAFNGSKHFPGNKLIDFFKKIGMNFGGDTNASTGFDRTIFLLKLPNAKHMKDALTIMSDYAQNISFDPEEIEKERGIILSEKRSRDTIGFRVMIEGFKFSFPKSILSKRMPIGVDETVNSVKREDFLHYYQTWYRPENMTLVVVGDIKTKKWGKRIKKTFKKFKAKLPKQAAVTLKPYLPAKGVHTKFIYEKESTQADVSIGTAEISGVDKRLYKDKIAEAVANSAARYIMNERLSEIAKEKDSPILSPSISSTDWMNQVKGGDISANCKPKDWKKALGVLDGELRKMIQYGFTDQELSLFKKLYMSSLDNAIKKMKTKSNGAYLGQIIGSVTAEVPFLDAKQKKKLMVPYLDKLTPADVLKAVKKSWAYDHRLILISSNENIADAEVAIKNAYLELHKKVVKKNKEVKLAAFPYEPRPSTSGKIKDKKKVDYDITRITFDNNVVLNYKKTDYKKDQISLRVNLGKGKVTVPAGKEAMLHSAGYYINLGGLEKLSKTQLDKALTGKQAAVNFSVAPNEFRFSGNSNIADFELMLQLLRAYLTAPGYREEAQNLITNYMPMIYNRLNTDIQANFNNRLNSLWHVEGTSFNPNLIPPMEAAKKIKSEDVKAWLKPHFDSGSLEINIIGDIDPAKVEELVAAYFGSLPERNVRSDVKRLKAAYVKPAKVVADFETKITKAFVAIFIPTTDFNNIEEIRALNLLGFAINDRVRKKIREELAISYSPYAGHQFFADYENLCYFQCYAIVEPNKVDDVIKAYQDLLANVLKTPITKEELDGVRKPIVTSIEKTLKTNGYWLGRVMSTSSFNENAFKTRENILG